MNLLKGNEKTRKIGELEKENFVFSVDHAEHNKFDLFFEL